MRNKSRQAAYTLTALTLVGCHKILTGEDPTSSTSTDGKTDSTDSPTLSATTVTGNTSDDDPKPDSGATGGMNTSSAADTIAGSTTAHGTSSTSPTTSSDTGETGAIENSSTGTPQPCNNPDYQCNPDKEAPEDCHQDCTWNLNCLDDHINEPGGECNKEINPFCPDCYIKWCGDGVLDPEEECDNGLPNDNKAFCSQKCRRNGIFAFVSHEVFEGDLGDFDMAEICDFLAESNPDLAKQNLTFSPWLDYANPGDWEGCKDLAKSRPIYLMDEETLISAQFPPSPKLSAPINRGQDGLPVDEKYLHVWTNLNSDGTKPQNPANCLTWTTAEKMDGLVGNVGHIQETDDSWTRSGGRHCNLDARIYCFEQPVNPCIDEN